MKRSPISILAAITALFCAASLPARASNEEAIETLNLAKFVLPEFPTVLRQNSVLEGYVTVALAPGRNEQGGPADFLVLGTTNPKFAESVTSAMNEWRFGPPRAQDNVKQPLPTVIRFQFLSGGVASISIPAFQASRTAKPAISTDTTIVLPTFADLDAVPKATNQPMPKYPAALRAEAVSGTTAVRFYVDSSGRVRMPVVTATTRPEFADAALDVLSQWTFEVPKQNGQPTVAIGTWNFNFGPNAR